MAKRYASFFLALMLVSLALVGAAQAQSNLPYGLPELEITGDTVTYLSWDSQRSMESDAANLLMQEVYGCKLKVVRTTYGELAGKAATLRMSGSSPDLIKFKDQEFPSFIANDIVEDVTDYIDFSDPLWADLKDTADLYAYQGRYYVYPCGKMYNNNYVYYWTQYFEDLGLETPLEMYENGEWTLSAMRDLMKELRLDDDRDGIVDIYGLVLNPIYSFPLCGEDFVTWDAETGLYGNNLRSAALANYFNFIHETGTTGDDTRLMSLEDISSFASKAAVMMMGERWVMTNYHEEILNGEVGITPAPRMDDSDENYARGRIDVYWLGKDSANRNGALAYLACSRAIALNDGLAEELAERAGVEYTKWPDDIKALRDEMDDPEKFNMIMIKSLGVGNWGSSDSGDGIFDLLSITTQFEIPWQTAMEKHYPLLQDSIDIANGAK